MHPEMGLEEVRTSGIVAERLRALGLDEIQTGIAVTGVKAMLRGGKPGKTLLLARRHGRATHRGRERRRVQAARPRT